MGTVKNWLDQTDTVRSLSELLSSAFVCFLWRISENLETRSQKQKQKQPCEHCCSVQWSPHITWYQTVALQLAHQLGKPWNTFGVPFVVSCCFTMFHISSWRMGIRGFYRGECGDIAGAYANCKSNISDRNHHIEQPLSLSQQPQPKPHETT